MSGSREKILAAARSHFARVGYDAATIRGIGSSARVDPALVLHYFGSKDHLFAAALEFPDPAEFVPRLLAPGVHGLGERLVTFFFETWDSSAGRPLLAMLRSIVTNEKAAAMMRQFITREVLGRVTAALEVDQPDLRASLAGSQLVGLAVLRYVVKLEPLVAADIPTLARWVGPTVQRYLSAPRDAGRTTGRRSARRAIRRLA